MLHPKAAHDSASHQLSRVGFREHSLNEHIMATSLPSGFACYRKRKHLDLIDRQLPLLASPTRLLRKRAKRAALSLSSKDEHPYYLPSLLLPRIEQCHVAISFVDTTSRQLRGHVRKGHEGVTLGSTGESLVTKISTKPSKMEASTDISRHSLDRIDARFASKHSACVKA